MGESTQPKRLKHLLYSEDGSLSVELVLWVPVIFMALMFITDATATFLAQASMWQNAGEISRALATGTTSLAEAQQFVSTYSRTTMQVQTLDNILVVQLSRPFSEIGTGIALSFVGDLQVQVFQRIEEGVKL
ncbi:MAG: hypothetical protein EA407_08290 [Rhodobacteraceae bacterium]|nr:MAG: hypothetical protein EA407_08290 [Paracoccaceae bacterium]